MSSTGLPPPAITKLAQYPPTGESAADLWFERANLDGTVLAGIAYGMSVFLGSCRQCIQRLMLFRCACDPVLHCLRCVMAST
jgi:hypothetical protein